MRLISSLFLFGCVLCIAISCRKPQTIEESNRKGNPSQKLQYDDSVFYLKSTNKTYMPLNGKTGVYTAFPDNLRIDRTTGAITMDLKGTDGESQTGMWYKIKYQSLNNEVDSTMILLSGITYVDKFYYFAANDSIVYPIYNADPFNPLPAASFFSKDKGLALDPATGQINLQKTMRDGFFNGKSWQTATIEYTLNDKSNSSPNQIDIVLYYYHTINDVPKAVSDIMQAHQAMTLGMRMAPIPPTNGILNESLPSELSLFKPRPPCIVIIPH